MKKILKIDEWKERHTPLFEPVSISKATGNYIVVERLLDKERFTLGYTVISKMKGIAKVQQFLSNKIHVAITFSQKYNGENSDDTRFVSIVPISDLTSVEDVFRKTENNIDNFYARKEGRTD